MIFDYAVVEELIEFSQIKLIPKDSIGCIQNRERDLSDAEVRSMFETIASSKMTQDIQAAFRILLLTMTRKGELQRARWQHLDFDRNEWHISREHSKTGRPHIVPLAPQVAALFRELKKLACQSAYVLPSRHSIRKPMDLSTLNHALKVTAFEIPHFTVHDLRRTAATLCAEGGFDSDLIELALNHVRAGILQPCVRGADPFLRRCIGSGGAFRSRRGVSGPSLRPLY
jgi:integrase